MPHDELIAIDLIVRLALRHPVTTGIIVLMNALGLLAYLVGW